MKISFSVDVPDLHERAIAARKARNLSQEEASKISGVSLKTIQFIEQGRRGMSNDVLISLCKAYRISPKKFLEGVDILAW